MNAPSLAQRLADQITQDGPITVAAFVEAALYDEAEGFYASGGQAGRRGDFITSVEVGPLFGAVISNAIDAWWEAAGRPSEFTVGELGAGPGTLARTVTLAQGACLRSGALRWVMIERSAAQRQSHPTGDHVISLDKVDPTGHYDVFFANEMLDNIAFAIAAHLDDGWRERRVDLVDGQFALVDAAVIDPPAGAEPLPVGTEVAVIDEAVAFIEWLRETWPGARLVFIDYAATTAELADRDGQWLRAYRDHQRVVDWLAQPGMTDITIDIPQEQLDRLAPGRIQTQAEFLSEHGIDALVAEGRRIWADGAHVGDLAAMRARSRISETEALQDRNGLGHYRVFQWAPDSGPAGDR